MNNAESTDPGPILGGSWATVFRRLGRDLAYVLPGFPLAIVSFCLLVTLWAVGVSTIVIWLGLLLLPVTLVIASGFAHVSRTRAVAWGAEIPPPRYRPGGSGITGPLTLLTDPRRWLDFVFEAVVTLPMRTVTFTIALAWLSGAVGGLTAWLWNAFLPDDSGGWATLIEMAEPDFLPSEAFGHYLVDSAINFVLGLIFAATIPLVIRGLAMIDASVTTMMLADVRPDGTTTGSGPWTPARPTLEPGGSTGQMSPDAWAWTVSSFVALVLVAVGWPILAVLYEVPVAVAMVVTVGHAVAVVAAVRLPWAGVGASIVVVLATMAVTMDMDTATVWPWPVTMLLTQSLLMIVVALRHAWIVPAVLWTGSAVATAVALAFFTDDVRGTPATVAVVATSVLAGLGAGAVLIKQWVDRSGHLRAAQRVSAEEIQRRRHVEERNRIARELHDVVAHSMSVISVQASTAQYRRQGLDETVRKEFEDIAGSSRAALAEMRSLLAILRGDHEAPTTPMPGVCDIESLVEATRASGADITFAHEVVQTSPTVGLTAFRVAQEALSNALRHAPGSAIDVAISHDEASGGLTVTVVNAAPGSEAAPATGSGLGLVGLRERVESLGGSIKAEPTADGGFRVLAVLPRTESAP